MKVEYYNPVDESGGCIFRSFSKYFDKDYNDVKIEMKSNDPSIVDNTGRVINPPAVATTVSYTITVTCGSVSKTITLYSVIPGTTSWLKWNGTYKSSYIWNEGNFVVNR